VQVNVNADRVVHVVPPNGGGVDRFVRDLCAGRREDWLLHVSEEQCVVESPDQGLFMPVAVNDLRALAERGVLGRAIALHAHSTVPAVRQAVTTLATGMRLPYLVTLHDVQFAGHDEGADPDETEERCEFIRGAARCTVPSHFMRDLALRVLGGSFDCQLVENGVDWQESAPYRPVAENFPIVTVGAIGEHKGLSHLEEVAGNLPANVRIALLGYAQNQLGEGWLADGKIRVHGPFEPERLPQLVADYGAVIAFFPRGQPESYCYALSDAWLAGLWVVAPNWGAIGERVGAHGGGSLYDPDASPAEIALFVVDRLKQANNVRLDVSAAVCSLSPVAAMRETMNKLYASIGARSVPADLDALKLAASKHLDSRFFRKELIRLQGDLAATGEQRDNALRELQTLATNFDKRGLWIDHLQRGTDDLKVAIERLHHESDALRQQLVEFEQLRAAHVELIESNAALLESYTSLKTVHERLMSRLTAPLRVLPASWQSWIIRTAKQKLISGDRNG
jgi:glycosyltransferase involved in cell wall biosynthesis